MALEDYIVPKNRKVRTICGVCQRNIYECAWMREGAPVEGWTAKRTYIKSNTGHTRSYCVTACPLYIAPSEERLAEQMRQDREDAKEHRREQDRRRSRLFF